MFPHTYLLPKVFAITRFCLMRASWPASCHRTSTSLNCIHQNAYLYSLSLKNLLTNENSPGFKLCFSFYITSLSLLSQSLLPLPNMLFSGSLLPLQLNSQKNSSVFPQLPSFLLQNLSNGLFRELLPTAPVPPSTLPDDLPLFCSW